MGNLVIKNGDILDATEEAICHQCNCVSINAVGLAKSIFKRYPWSNVYSRHQRREPGTFRMDRDVQGILKAITQVKENKTSQNSRTIVHIFGQIYPGKSKYKTGRDTVGQRIKYFKSAMNSLIESHYSDIPGLGRDFLCKGYAFPYKIGCGFAGGDWNVYLEEIERFAKSMEVPVALYKFDK